MAASFIRRRPLTFGCLTIVGLVLALVVALVIQVFRVGARQPNIAVNYIEILNEPAKSVLEEERAWPLYERAIQLNTLDENAAYAAIDDDDYELLAELIGEQQPVLDLLQQIADRPHYGFLADETAIPGPDGQTVPPSVFETELAPMGEMRSLARLLQIDTALAAEQGDADRVVRNLRALHRVADHAAQPPTTIGQLVGFAVQSLAAGVLVDTLDRAPDLLSDGHFAELDAAIASSNGGKPIRFETELERQMFDDILQRVFTDDGNGDGVMTVDGVLGHLSTAGLGGGPNPLERAGVGLAAIFASGRAETRERFSEMMDIADELATKQPFEITGDPYDEAWERLDEDARFPPDVTLMMVSTFVPTLGKATSSGMLAEARRDVSRVIIALHRHRQASGSFPESLAVLVPEFLPEVPVDPFDGQPLRYSLTPDGPLLYSIGVDRNDDGGRRVDRSAGWEPAAKAAAREASDPLNYDGDWVFFPPEQEEEEDDE